jgi:hypothetical protein
MNETVALRPPWTDEAVTVLSRRLPDDALVRLAAANPEQGPPGGDGVGPVRCDSPLCIPHLCSRVGLRR